MSLTVQVRPAPINLRRTLGPLVVEWIEANLCHGPGDVQGQPWELDDEQVRFLMRAYEIDDAGRRVVRRAVYSRPKGRAKSELAAGMVCAEALGPVRFSEWGPSGYPRGRRVQTPIVICAATEEGQADNTYGAAYVMLREGEIADTPGLDVGITRTFIPGGGKIYSISARATSKDGGKETFVNLDETHLWSSPELHRLASTLRRNLAKRKAAEPWSLETSTMYSPGEDSVAEGSHTFAQAIAKGKASDPGFLFDHLEAPDPETWDFDDDDQLRAALRVAYGEASEWMDFERLIAEARDPATRRSDFIRYFLNRPAANTGRIYISADRWKELGEAGDGDPVATPLEFMPEGTRVCLGMDGSRNYDTTVVAWAGRNGDHIDVDACVFSVRKDAPHHELHEGGKIDFDAVEDFAVDRFDVYEVAEAAYDPRYLVRSAELLDRRLPESRIIEVEPQSKHMRDALLAFYTLVIDGTVRHRGDPVLLAHIAACQGQEDERGWRVYKLKQSRPIDAVIAMALAVWRAQVAKPAPKPFVLTG